MSNKGTILPGISTTNLWKAILDVNQLITILSRVKVQHKFENLETSKNNAAP